MNFEKVFNRIDPKTQAKWREWNGAEFLIAPSDNKFARNEILNIFTLQEAAELEENGLLAFASMNAKDAFLKIYGIYSKTLIFDWKDVKDAEDNDIPFSSEKALEFMLEYQEFADWVQNEAKVVSEERQKETSNRKKK